MNTYPIIQKYAINLTEQVKNGKFQYADEFDWHINRTIQVLGRRRNQRPTLVNGTAEQRLKIVLGIAIKQCQPNILLPSLVKQRAIWSLDLKRVFRDAETPEMLEATLRKLLDEWKTNNTSLLLFIDDIQQLYEDSEIHKVDFGVKWFMIPTLRGEAFGIWGTTWEAYKQHMHKAHINVFRNMTFIGNVPTDAPSYKGSIVPATHYPLLEKYAINLTKHAKNGEFEYAEEYDTQINRAIQVLYRGVVNSPVLIDDSSEKKQAVVHSVVLKLLEVSADHEDSRAYYFSNKEVWSLNIPKLIANHNMPQSFKICLINLIKELTKKEHIILYIDPAHKVIGSCHELLEPDDMQYLLYMPVRRRNFQVIWGTDIEAYKNCLGSHEASDKTIFRTKIFFKDYPSWSEFPFHPPLPHYWEK